MSEMECTNEKRGFLQDNDLTIDAAEQYGNGGPQTSERHSRSQDSKVQFQDRPNSRESSRDRSFNRCRENSPYRRNYNSSGRRDSTSWGSQVTPDIQCISRVAEEK
ncbi:hypothetical protein OUZ56_011735 [Daphnia magna]|uniref:Uncharacterized protein n=1 Tax=Daphnia magna TaxID=35525 RepID=A0ABQ9Z2B2_9CRUS|nr:hypothetical protein OUZ56_011735 [Daphnia magna]